MLRTFPSWKTKALRVVSLFLTLGLLMSGSVSAAGGPGGRWLWQASAPSHETTAATNGAIAGNVRKSADSAPLAGAVVVAHSGPELYDSTTSDSQGAYSFMGLMPGTYEVSATASGHAAATRGNIVVAANTTARIDFALDTVSPPQTSGSLTGQVKAAATGQALPGATVLLLQNAIVLQGALADANGLYLFREVGTGAYSALAFAPGFLAGSQGNIVINANATARVDFSLALIPAPLKGSIAGRITSAVTGAAIQNAQIEAKAGADVIAQAGSNANGEYTLADLIVGSYTLRVSASGFQTATQDTVLVSPNTTTRMDFALQPVVTGAITGEVTSAVGGAAIPGAQVSANRDGAVIASVNSNAAGEYILANLAAGAYKLQATASGFQTATTEGVAVSPNATTRVDFALQPAAPAPPPPVATGSLTGRVVSAADGKPIAGAVEVLKQRFPIPLVSGSDEEAPLRTTSDAEGKFSFSGVEPGVYRLQAKGGGFHGTKIDNIAVLAGQTTVVNVALRPKEEQEREQRQRGSITGRVTDGATGKPVEGAVVFFTPSHGQDKDGRHRRFARTDEDGKYKLEGVLIGAYQLHARAKGYKPVKEEHVRVQAGLATTVNFELRAVRLRDSKDRADDDGARERAQERAEKAREKAERDDDNGHRRRGRVQLATSGELQAGLSASARVPSPVAAMLSF